MKPSLPSSLHADNVESPDTIPYQSVVAESSFSASAWTSSQRCAVAMQEAWQYVISCQLPEIVSKSPISHDLQLIVGELKILLNSHIPSRPERKQLSNHLEHGVLRKVGDAVDLVLHWLHKSPPSGSTTRPCAIQITVCMESMLRLQASFCSPS